MADFDALGDLLVNESRRVRVCTVRSVAASASFVVVSPKRVDVSQFVGEVLPSAVTASPLSVAVSQSTVGVSECPVISPGVDVPCWPTVGYGCPTVPETAAPSLGASFAS
jgi:hypothetical protein